MRKLKVAYGRSSGSRYWRNDTVEWDALCGRFKETFRTAETQDEYAAMDSDERDKRKDRGGFVGGRLKNGRRLKENVECRSFLSLDGDSVEVDERWRCESAVVGARCQKRECQYCCERFC